MLSKITLRSQIERYYKNKDKLTGGLARYISLAMKNYCHEPNTYSNPITDDELAIGLYDVFNLLEG